ncbi:uncharacterized protein LOC112573947 isoform X1 [Pomacea canaliculata]|uniref:uncharacterized protein LOC112573947 isoform X1 n=2 Tax=Pomacea canaliculata TaxID=400727 RepID=UPI000D72CD3C|nr:uncharacterized protein LOC112573947 isoform X1 [Pomacea canaliculata]
MADDELNLAGGHNPDSKTTTTTTTTMTTTTTRSLKTPRPRPTTPKPTTTTVNVVTPEDSNTGDDNSGEGADPGEGQQEADQCSTQCEPLADTHKDFIEKNLELMQTKCDKYHTCTGELFNSENIYRIIAGGNIQLRNICGLVYSSSNGSYRTLNDQCSPTERESIRQQLNDELIAKTEKQTDEKSAWGKLSACLDRRKMDDEDPINTLCRIKGSTTAPLCNMTDVQTTTETFFNEKLSEFHCSCDAVKALTQESPVRLGALLGGICSGAVVLLLIVVIIVLCLRHRKLKRRLTAESKSSGNNMSPMDDSWPIYQEINDPSRGPDAWLNWGNPGYRLAHRPATLPNRYTLTYLKGAASPNDHEYLEPLPDISNVQPGQTLPGPLRDLQYDLAQQVAPSPNTERKTMAGDSAEGVSKPPEESTYFEKLDWQAGKDNDEDGGYSTLVRKPTLRVRGPPEVGEELQPLNSQPPASEEDQGHSSTADPPYFVLV